MTTELDVYALCKDGVVTQAFQKRNEESATLNVLLKQHPNSSFFFPRSSSQATPG